MTNCIYRIECLNPEIKDFYIGSTGDLKERIANHKCCCNNINRPEYNYKLYKFIRNHGGWDNWRIDIELLTTGYDKEIRIEMEQNYIDCIKPQLNSKNAKTDRKEYTKQYKVDNMEKIKEQNKQYYLDNKDKIREHAKQYRLNNKEKAKQYKVDNMEKLKEQNKQYRLDNIEKIRVKRSVKSKCPDCGKEMLKNGISSHIRLNRCKGKETPSLINLADICPPKMVE